MINIPKVQNSTWVHANASIPPVFADPYIGFVLEGRYQILELIGMGGWGNVYRAKHLSLELDLAVKIIHQHHLQDQLSIKRFEQEAQLLSRVETLIS